MRSGLIHEDSALIEAIKRQARKVGADTIGLVGDPDVHGDRVPPMEPVKTRYAVLLRTR